MNAVVLGLLEREWEAQSGRDRPFAITCRVTEVLELAYGGAVRDLPEAGTPGDLLAGLGPAAPAPWALRVLTALSELDHRPVPAPAEAGTLVRPGPAPPLPLRPGQAATPARARQLTVSAARPRIRVTRLVGAHLLAAGAGFGLAMTLGSSSVLLGTFAAVAGAWAALLIPARKPPGAIGAFHDDDKPDREANPHA
ncbi:hypothetical protein [Nonomuraea jiangxiensis]|uniref:Uncharacterized protein n=1 Tax=Nonomuraea jiangxiensis TaxID=633440 RepID=A0A1G9EWI6_9ACTN|nr:hypothetical protein [Nonomuraea jiangxiensis]SDK80375.1 hypothetical protein SAMN05421869_11939 [Nonomuraea jiangxiensis]